jgi:predicted RND superfamily exporter protein
VVVLLMRNVSRTIGVLLPPVIALVWTFGLMGWLNIELTPFTVLGAAFVGGIGIDSAIFLSQPHRRASALSPVMAASLTTVVGVSTLLLANHPMIYSIGQTLVIGMTASLIACVLITPSVVRE